MQLSDFASTHMWKGRVTKELEHLLLTKTLAPLCTEVESAILLPHSYKVPEIVEVQVLRGLDRYLAWITASAG